MSSSSLTSSPPESAAHLNLSNYPPVLISIPNGGGDQRTDANWLADRLGVSPLYMKEEKARWTNAVQIYSSLIGNNGREHLSDEENSEPRVKLTIGSPPQICSLLPPSQNSERVRPKRSATSNGHGHRPIPTGFDAGSDLQRSHSVAKMLTSASGSSLHSQSQPRPIGGSSQRRQLEDEEFPPATPPSSLIEEPTWRPLAHSASGSRLQQPPLSSKSNSTRSFRNLVSIMGPGDAEGHVFSPQQPSSREDLLSREWLDEDTQNSLELEAVAAVHELSFAVESIAVSEMLPRTPELIFVNVTTLEGTPFCLELTQRGWRVTSFKHDCMNGDYLQLALHTRYFESPYALMDQISPLYRDRFGERLAARLRLYELEVSDSQESGLRASGGTVAPASSYNILANALYADGPPAPMERDSDDSPSSPSSHSPPSIK